MEEIWKDMPDYKGFYQVSNLGRIKSFLQKKERLRRQHIDRYGYVLMMFSKYGMIKSIRVHQVVAAAFIEKPKGKDFVNHKNGNKSDNRVENLEWVTKSYNSKHSFEIGVQDNKGVKHPMARLTEKEVLEIRAKFKPYQHMRESLAKEYNVKPATIKAIVLRLLWPHI